MKHPQLHRLLARIGIASEQTQLLQGSTQAVCARYQGSVYKAAPKAQAQAEINRLQLLRQVLGAKANLIAAPTLRVSGDDWWLYMTPDLGETSFDTLLEAMVTHPAPDALQRRLSQILTRVLTGIADVHHSSRRDSPDDGGAFVQELMAAIEMNLRQSQVHSDPARVLLRAAPAFGGAFYASLLHRDLSPINIMVTGLDDTVCFIDPRGALPHLPGVYTHGCIGFDLVGLEIGVLRRQAACLRFGARGTLSWTLSQIKDAREQSIRTQAASRAIEALCRVAWWSAYAACRCDFCLEPTRLWLYEDAVRHLHKSIDEALTFV